VSGRGEIVEWAVHMRRFEQSALLGNVARGPGITPHLAKRLADAVFESHRSAAASATASGALLMTRVLTPLAQSLLRSDVLDANAVQAFFRHAEDQLRRAAPVLDERARRGCVRRCHGDLHLWNIVLWQGQPVLYDAIEFDEDLATTDTLYDLAFLLMDLDRHGQGRAANEVLNRYVWRSGEEIDIKGLRALPLFLALRAGIRALVSADRAAQASAETLQEFKQRATAYLRLGLGYSTPPPPRLVAVGGLSGTGKTTLAAALAARLHPAPGAVHLRSDLERKSLFGVGETVRLGPDSYSQEIGEQVYTALRRKARLALEAGHAVVVDAVSARADERDALEALAAELRVPFHGFWLHAVPDALIARVAARRNDASDATAEVVRQQLGFDVGAFPSAWTPVDANGSAEEALAHALRTLEAAAVCRPCSSARGAENGSAVSRDDDSG
jgi:aminoglycoside phosphotransferase family enzyme/predicted kinase